MKYISISKHVIESNFRNGPLHIEPPIRISNGLEDPNPVYAYQVNISGPSRMLYSPHDPIIKRFGVHLVTEAENVEVVK